MFTKKKIKTCVILAGGVGSRLFEETKIKPKPLVEIGKKPILYHIIKYYLKNNINEFIICLGYKGNLINEYFKKNFKFQYVKKNQIIIQNKHLKNAKIFLVNTGKNAGTGGRLRKIENLISKNSNFILTYGDGLYNLNLKKLINFHIKHKKLATMSITRPKNRYGLAFCNKDTLISFNENKRIEKKDNNWINAGVFIINKKVIKYIPNNETFFEQKPIQKLIKKNQINAFKHYGKWMSMDTLKDKIEIEKLWKKNPFWK